MKSQACAGGRNFSGLANYCHVGYEGPLCEVCSRNFFKETASNTCAACDRSNLIPTLVGVLFAMLLLIAGCYLLFLHGGSHAGVILNGDKMSAGLSLVARRFKLSRTRARRKKLWRKSERQRSSDE